MYHAITVEGVDEIGDDEPDAVGDADDLGYHHELLQEYLLLLLCLVIGLVEADIQHRLEVVQVVVLLLELLLLLVVEL